MVRRVSRSVLAGLAGCALSGLAGCGSLWETAEREPWRAEVEAACLASGQVRETAGITLAKAIEGPGVCGIDHPFRVASLDGVIKGGASFAALVRPAPPAPDPGMAEGGLPPADVGAADADADGLAPVGDTPGYTPLPTLPAAPQPQAVTVSDDAPFAVSLDRSVVISCSMIPALTAWLQTEVQPAALANFGQPVVGLVSFGTYSCRRMDNRKTGHMSEHAYANAIDIKAFTLADGRTTSVLRGWNGSPAEQGFWRDAAFGACRRFTTVLGPGASDGQHQNHLHLDLARHSATRLVHICRPRVPGGWISTAQRVAQARLLAAQTGAAQTGAAPAGAAPLPPEEPAYTGSIEEPLGGEDDD